MGKKLTLKKAVECIRGDIPEHYPAGKVLLAFADKLADALPQHQEVLIRAAKRAGLGETGNPSKR